jgi:hypothetical protein
VAADNTGASLLLIALWFGLLTGWVEALVWFVRKYFEGQHLFFMGPDFLWMVPLTNLVAFVTLGLVLSLISWRWPKLLPVWAGTSLLAFLSLFSTVLLLFPQLHAWAVLLLATGLAVQTGRLIAKHPQGFHRLVRYGVAWPVFLGRAGKGHTSHQGEREVSPSPQLSRRHFLIGAGAAIGVAAAGVRGWQWLAEHRALAALPQAKRDMPNVLLIVLDTVRAGSLSLYGYQRPTTPNLSRLAQNGVLFERAIAPAPWTLPSHASMFTGRWPHELSTGWTKPLDDTYPTLAEILSAHGYVSAGFVANLSYCS